MTTLIKRLLSNSAWGQEIWRNGIEVGQKEATMQAIKDVEKTLPDFDDLLNERISSLLGIVDERKVVREDKLRKFIFIGDEQITPERRHNLQQEAEVITQTELWSLMENTIRKSAHNKLMVEAKDLNDLLAGKMALYNLDLLKKILTVFLSK